MLRHVLFPVIAATLLSACATKPISSSDAIQAPANRVYVSAATGDTYQIRITRDAGFAGSGCPARIYLDGKDAADLEAAETVLFTVSVGRHMIGASPSPLGGKMCSAFDAAARHRREAEVAASSGETRNYRFSISASGVTSLDPSAF